MRIEFIAPEAYSRIFATPDHFYATVGFNLLNSDKAEDVRFAVGYDDNVGPRLGLIVGLRDETWCAPFSAPFAGLEIKGEPEVATIRDFFTSLRQKLGNTLKITLPPPFYAPAKIAAMVEALKGIATDHIKGVNHHYDLSRAENYADYLNRAARKNMRRASEAGFTFRQTDDIEGAYEVIRANRASHDYHLSMTLPQVKATAPLAHAEFYLLSLGEEDVAAAMIYPVAEGIVQVIYWGDAPGYSDKRPMNLLPIELFRHYAARGVKIMDIGPSSIGGVPNEGLCRFKESLGCEVTDKYAFII